MLNLIIVVSLFVIVSVLAAVVALAIDAYNRTTSQQAQMQKLQMRIARLEAENSELQETVLLWTRHYAESTYDVPELDNAIGTLKNRK